MINSNGTQSVLSLPAEGIRGDRAQAPYREGEDHATVQNEDIRTGRYSSQVQILVLLTPAEKVQEVHRRDRVA
jgi:hypothetical protein